MKLFTPFTIPQKDNCDLCRIKTKKRREAENPFLDQLFKTLYRDRFDLIIETICAECNLCSRSFFLAKWLFKLEELVLHLEARFNSD